MPRPTEPRGTIAVAFVRQALQALARRGMDPALALAKSGLAPDVLSDDRARVGPEVFGSLWLTIADLLDDELFGLDSRPMRVGSFATLCHLMLHTPDLRTALVRGARLVSLLLADLRVELDLEGPEARMRFVELGERPLPARVFAHETLFVMLHGLICWLLRRRIVIHDAGFSYPPPEWHPEYLLIVGESLHFGQAETCFTFGASDLDAPVVQTEATAREFLKGAPHNFLLKYKDPQSVSFRVRRLLRELPPEQWPDFEQLARQLRRHPTTLRRRLEEEGSSYRMEKSARRRDLALEYMASPERSVLEVAHALGFAEPSAFHRAFRQWTGMSPGEYRKVNSSRFGDD
ncbi:AraC family transcriptional regulator [Solimonas sp. K1W22B-7]|uniref:AraC family transcriptional regulator n=1 Tax=Solimonas sp. K1W22B-7 TaxID=2303331 RepID=UPI000E330298|nr:AraC family transcriptional regulator [Solimonas sp. K1W22B-7]AXQ28896.1 AraC family transcriptional regulator [Solimonas sp. K1W22B-7]